MAPPTYVHHSLSSSSPAEFSVYKPLLMMFSLVDSLHRVLKTTLSVSGSDLPTALLEHVRTNDSTVLEASDKVQLWWSLPGHQIHLVAIYPNNYNDAKKNVWSLLYTGLM